MPLSVGCRVGPYEILAPVGKGGMGEVYRAKDSNLKREVALKVLPEAFAADAERMARFRREALVLASLNHPHIAQIYGVEEGALVMELVPGAPIRGPLPLATALSYAGQIAEALESAHEKGIVHRDLKPGNILVTPDGVVKVLDFGLAAVSGSIPLGSEAEGSTTMTLDATGPGVVLGTPAYMSPEQASGKPVDRRSDIWSFGVVLYELLRGTRLFTGSSNSEILAKVMASPIVFDSVPVNTPPVIVRLLRRCLDRDPRTRLRDVGEARVAIQSYLANPEGELAETGGGSRPGRVALWTMAALCAALAAGAGYLWTRGPGGSSEPREARFQIPAAGTWNFAKGLSATAASPDGRYLVFSGMDGENRKPMLWLRPIDSLNVNVLPGTENGDFPFWSPDSRSVGFFADGRLKRINLDGGIPLTLCEATDPGPSGGSWNRDGVVLFASKEGLHRVSAAGGVPTRITQVNAAQRETAHGFPQFLPDGKRFLFFVQSSDPGVQGVYASTIAEPLKRSLVLKTDHKALLWPARGSQQGYLLWTREQTLLAQPFDDGKMMPQGDPVRVAENLAMTSTATNILAPALAAFWVSDSGVLAYHQATVPSLRMIWVGRDGKELGEVATADKYLRRPRLSPDGRNAIVRRIGISDQSSDEWMLDLGRGVLSRLSTDGKESGFADWSPDGRTAAYSSSRTGVMQIYRKDTAGGGREVQMTDGPEPNYVTNWSRDGRHLLATHVIGNTYEIVAYPADKNSKEPPILVDRSEYYGGSAAFSPDGKWVAFHSASSGATEIYVAAFREGGGAGSGRWQVSTQGGKYPRWRADGKELFFVSPGNGLMAAKVREASGRFESEGAELLFGGPPFEEYDVSADGKRFLVQAPVAGSGRLDSPLTVVLNWQAQLR